MSRELLDHLRLTSLHCEAEADRLADQAAEVVADWNRRNHHPKINMSDTSDQDVYNDFMNRAIQQRSMAGQARRHWRRLAREAEDVADEAAHHPVKGLT